MADRGFFNLSQPVQAGSIFHAFGAPSMQEYKIQQEREAKMQAAKLSAMQLALKTLPVGDPRRDPIEASMMQHFGGGQDAANAITAIRPDVPDPEQFTLGEGQRRFVTDAQGTRQIAQGAPRQQAAGSSQKTSKEERLGADWLRLRSIERERDLTPDEKDKKDLAWRVITKSERAMEGLMRAALAGQGQGGTIPEPPQPGIQTSQPESALTETQVGWIENGKKAITAGKDRNGVIEKIRQRTGLSREQIEALL